MRWFKVDSDWQEEDRIVRILERMELAAETGVAGCPPAEWVQAVTHGALVDLWSLAARQDGARLPGYLEEQEGRPIGLAKMARHCGVPRAFIERLLDACAAEGHIDPVQWAAGKLVVFPGMIKRADVYTQRRLRSATGGDTAAAPDAEPVRTPSDQSVNVPLHSKNGTGTALKKEEAPGTLPLAGADQVDKLIEIWNTGTTHPLPKVDPNRVTANRRRGFAAALAKLPNLEDWRLLIRYTNRQGHLRRPGFLADGRRNPSYTGGHPNFTADLDWLCKGDKAQRTLEKLSGEQPAPGAEAEEGGKYGGIGS